VARQIQREHAAAPGSIDHVDLAVAEPGALMRDREPEAQSGSIASSLLEWSE
jgi:hypothetical protein